MLIDGRSKEEQIIAKLENDARDEIHSIMGMLDLMAQDPLTLTQSSFLRTCKLNADRVLRSIQNVSIFLNREVEQSQTSTFDLHETVTKLAGLMETLTTRKNLTLTCDIGPAVPRLVVGDQDRLQDVLARILDNAVRFTDRGGVRLIVTQLTREIGKCFVRLEICDTGPGIPADVLGNTSKPLPEQSVGRGLGLAIIKKLALSMGGDIKIDSQASGSRVALSLPFEEATANLPGPNDAPRTIAPLNILVAEDSDDSYYVLEGYLQEQEHRLTRAVDGSRAVELFKTGNYDLVLMDIHMPDMDGYSAARAIRVWETGCARARVPIVVLSSDSPATQFQNGARAGCSGYLTKPVSCDALQTILKRYATTARM